VHEQARRRDQSEANKLTDLPQLVDDSSDTMRKHGTMAQTPVSLILAGIFEVLGLACQVAPLAGKFRKLQPCIRT
jgi:hypothetical protein